MKKLNFSSLFFILFLLGCLTAYIEPREGFLGGFGVCEWTQGAGNSQFFGNIVNIYKKGEQ